MKKVYKIFNNFFDLLSGFDIEKEKENQISFDFFSREEIIHYQKEKFQKLTQIISDSEYYAGYSGKDLVGFPLVDRNEYQNNVMRMKTNNKSPYYFRYSSGSTGTPVQQYVTKDMLLAKRASHQKMLSWYGLTRESPEFKLGGVPIGAKVKIYYYFKNKRYYTSESLLSSTFEKISNEFNKFKPEVLSGYPSVIYRFLSYAIENNKNLFQPKIILTHAENLYPDMIKMFKLVFPDIHVVNQYWATEANIAETCPHGNLHIDENTVICEVLNTDRNGVGDLYITNLFSYIVPLIRYKIGDRIKISDKICECGRNTRIIESFEGRENQYLELEDGRKFSFGAIGIIVDNCCKNLNTYQVDYYKYKKKIIFKYIPINSEKPINEQFLRNNIKSKFGLSIEFKKVLNLNYTLGGKFKRFNNL